MLYVKHNLVTSCLHSYDAQSTLCTLLRLLTHGGKLLVVVVHAFLNVANIGLEFSGLRN